MRMKEKLPGIPALMLVFVLALAGCGKDPQEITGRVSLEGIGTPEVTGKPVKGGVMLSWPPVIDASSYEVWRGGGGQPAARKLAGIVSPNHNGMYEYFDIVSFTNELKPNTEYTYTVIAVPLGNVRDITKWERNITTDVFPEQGGKADKPESAEAEINFKNLSVTIKVTPPARGNIPNGYRIGLYKDNSLQPSLSLNYFNDPEAPFELTLYGNETGDAAARALYTMLSSPGSSYTIAVSASLDNTSLSKNAYYKLSDEIRITKSESAASVDDYSGLEPGMDPNSNRAVARAGSTTVIPVPASLANVPGTAVFTINEADGSVARIVSQNGSSCTIEGLALGSARVEVAKGAQSATVVVSVAPRDSSYTLAASAAKRLGEYTSWDSGAANRPDDLPDDYANYIAEPTTQLAWYWRNKGSFHGLSGEDCGIDFLAYYVDPANSGRRGWVRTTFGFGGWHYDLNGATNNMTNGVQVNGDVRLELKPEFVYDNGTPYLQITHTLTNTGASRLTGQKFGASADIMIYGNDAAPLSYLEYGALMTNNVTRPTIKFRFVCQNVQGVNNVSTLWMGTYGGERGYVYADRRQDVTGNDSAMNFSYQNIDLNAGESKTFAVRFTQIQ